MESAARSATGRPKKASRARARTNGPPSPTDGDKAGAMQAPRASASTNRVGAGTAASPNAGTSVTAGVARAIPRAQARGSTPIWSKTAPSASMRLGGGGKGAMAIDAGAEGALTVTRLPRTAYGFGYFHSRLRDGTNQLHLRLEDGGLVCPRGG